MINLYCYEEVIKTFHGASAPRCATNQFIYKLVPALLESFLMPVRPIIVEARQVRWMLVSPTMILHSRTWGRRNKAPQVGNKDSMLQKSCKHPQAATHPRYRSLQTFCSFPTPHSSSSLPAPPCVFLYSLRCLLLCLFPNHVKSLFGKVGRHHGLLQVENLGSESDQGLLQVFKRIVRYWRMGHSSECVLSLDRSASWAQLPATFFQHFQQRLGTLRSDFVASRNFLSKLEYVFSNMFSFPGSRLSPKMGLLHRKLQ